MQKLSIKKIGSKLKLNVLNYPLINHLMVRALILACLLHALPFLIFNITSIQFLAFEKKIDPVMMTLEIQETRSEIKNENEEIVREIEKIPKAEMTTFNNPLAMLTNNQNNTLSLSDVGLYQFIEDDRVQYSLPVFTKYPLASVNISGPISLLEYDLRHIDIVNTTITLPSDQVKKIKTFYEVIVSGKDQSIIWYNEKSNTASELIKKQAQKILSNITFKNESDDNFFKGNVEIIFTTSGNIKASN